MKSLTSMMLFIVLSMDIIRGGQLYEPRAISNDIGAFSEIKCPKIKSFKKNQVLTWQDWVTLISGNCRDYYYWKPINGLGWDTHGCFEAITSDDSYDYLPGNNKWACTVGKPRGKNGRPIAETKPFDTSFWYYQSVPKLFKGGILGDGSYGQSYEYLNPTNEAIVWTCSYDQAKGGWVYPAGGMMINGQYYEIDSILSTYIWFEPGVYGAYLPFWLGDNGLGRGAISCIDEDGKETNIVQTRAASLDDLGLGANPNHWITANAIFFVDSPVRFYPHWNGSGVWNQGVSDYTNKRWYYSIFRITPPGYWVP